ncbi:MAG: hypothetical protein ACHREM_22100 [Polyangiales bacterium]
MTAEHLAFKSHIRHEISCSQSFESSSESVDYVLTLTPPSTASLTARVSETSTFGPSLGRFRGGARDFSSTGDDRDYDWAGRARWVDDKLVIELDGSSHCARPRVGASSCAAPGLPTIRCAYADVEVLPALGATPPADRAKQATTKVRALRCGPELGLTKLDVEESERAGLIFHTGRAIAASVEYGALMSYAPGVLELRFVP